MYQKSYFYFSYSVIPLLKALTIVYTNISLLHVSEPLFPRNLLIIERGQCESTQILNIWRAQERNYFITNKHRRWTDDVMDVPGRFYIVLPVKGAFAQWKNWKVSFPSVGGVEVWGKLRCGGFAVWGNCGVGDLRCGRSEEHTYAGGSCAVTRINADT